MYWPTWLYAVSHHWLRGHATDLNAMAQPGHTAVKRSLATRRPETSECGQHHAQCLPAKKGSQYLQHPTGACSPI